MGLEYAGEYIEVAPLLIQAYYAAWAMPILIKFLSHFRVIRSPLARP